jgi:hypothetical protein
MQRFLIDIAFGLAIAYMALRAIGWWRRRQACDGARDCCGGACGHDGPSDPSASRVAADVGIDAGAMDEEGGDCGDGCRCHERRATTTAAKHD